LSISISAGTLLTTRSSPVRAACSSRSMTARAALSGGSALLFANARSNASLASTGRSSASYMLAMFRSRTGFCVSS
jgi:hypothetical protein